MTSRTRSSTTQPVSPDRERAVTEKREPCEVKIVRPEYQPSKAELNEDVRVDASFEEAVDALTRPVKVRYIDEPTKRRTK